MHRCKRAEEELLAAEGALKVLKGYPEHATDWCVRLNGSMLRVKRIILEQSHHGRAC